MCSPSTHTHTHTISCKAKRFPSCAEVIFHLINYWWNEPQSRIEQCKNGTTPNDVDVNEKPVAVYWKYEVLVAFAISPQFCCAMRFCGLVRAFREWADHAVHIAHTNISIQRWKRTVFKLECFFSHLAFAIKMNMRIWCDEKICRDKEKKFAITSAALDFYKLTQKYY